MYLKYNVVFLICVVFSFLFVTIPADIYAEEIKVSSTAITQAHNELRKKYGSPPLIYSMALEQAAKKWAKTLQLDGCRMRHSNGDSGENIYWASPYSLIKTDHKGDTTQIDSLQKKTDKQVVDTWYEEVQWYDYETNGCQKGKMCGHYTQLIWKTTRELGCAAIACQNFSQIWVCEYAPAGNIYMRYPNGTVKKLKPY